MSVRCWPIVYDAGPTLSQHWIDASFCWDVFFYREVFFPNEARRLGNCYFQFAGLCGPFCILFLFLVNGNDPSFVGVRLILRRRMLPYLFYGMNIYMWPKFHKISSENCFCLQHNIILKSFWVALYAPRDIFYAPRAIYYVPRDILYAPHDISYAPRDIFMHHVTYLWWNSLNGSIIIQHMSTVWRLLWHIGYFINV